MAKKAVNDEGVKAGIKMLLDGAKRDISYKINDFLKTPMSWKSVFWDSNILDEFPDHVMRLMRFLVGLASITKIIGFIYLGAFLVVDGFYSIYRHRVELAITKNWREDVPRIARLMFGLIIMSGVLRI